MHAACLSYVKAVAYYFLYFTHACVLGDCVCPWRLYDVSAFWWLDSHSGCVSLLLHSQGQSTASKKIVLGNRDRVHVAPKMGRWVGAGRRIHTVTVHLSCTSPLVLTFTSSCHIQ